MNERRRMLIAAQNQSGGEVPRDGLVAEYMFNDWGDTSGNGYNLSYRSGGTIEANQISGMHGIPKCFYSNGGTAQANGPVLPKNGILTISFWVKMPVQTEVVLFGTTLGSARNGIMMDVYNSGLHGMIYRTGDTAKSFIFTASGLSDNNWHHICLLGSPTNALYIDNQHVTTNPSIDTLDTIYDGVNLCLSGATSSLNTHTSFSYPLNGYMAAFRVYNRTLSLSELDALYNEAR